MCPCWRREQGHNGFSGSADPIFTPLTFPSGLTIKNRVVRSNISGRIDNYDGSVTMARVNWEEKFARGGVGAVLSSHVPIHVRQGTAQVWSIASPVTVLKSSRACRRPLASRGTPPPQRCRDG